MDLHPPHHPLTTWREFFVHMATIVLGLLIAIGLEQSVEALHHRHQRHQLEEDLRHECEYNREVLRNDMGAETATLAWYLKANASAQEALAGRPAPFPLRPVDDPQFRANFHYVVPTDSVWQTAKSSGMVALLPRDEALLYTRPNRIHELMVQADLEGRRAGVLMRAALVAVETNPPKTPEKLDGLPPERLNALSSGLLQMYAAGFDVKLQLMSFDAANEAVLGGAKSEKEMIDAIYKGYNAQFDKQPEVKK